MAAKLSGRQMMHEVELLGERTAAGVAADKIKRGKLDDLATHADRLDAARQAELAAAKALDPDSLVVDANVVSAVREMMDGTQWKALQPHKHKGINWLRSKAKPKLPPLDDKSPALKATKMEEIIGEGHDLRVANAVIGESATKEGLQRGGLDLKVSRDSKVYNEVLDELEKEPKVGKPKGAGADLR
jgi:hypothetical protein